MSVRVATWNVNGVRAALGKGLLAHLDVVDPDVVLLQEVRATPMQAGGSAPGWRWSWHAAERAGYAGVATWSRADRVAVEELGRGLDGEPDPDGRVLRSRVGDLELVNVYVPSGSMGPPAQARKDVFFERFLPYLARLVQAPHPVLVGGDLNVAPTELDIHDPRGNKRNSGFLPHERAWFASVLELGWVDLVRSRVGPVQGPYSWWSHRGTARAEDRGWRIDHLLGNRAAAARVVDVGVHRAGGLEVSDHAPVWVDLADANEVPR